MEYLRRFETARVVLLNQAGIDERHGSQLVGCIETPKSPQDLDFAAGILGLIGGIVHVK